MVSRPRMPVSTLPPPQTATDKVQLDWNARQWREAVQAINELLDRVEKLENP